MPDNASTIFLKVDEDRRKFSRFVDWLHKIYSIDKGTCERIYVAQWKTEKSSNDYETISRVARSVDKPPVKAAKMWDKQEWAVEIPKLVNARKMRGMLFYWSWRQRLWRDQLKLQEGRWRCIWKWLCRAGNIHATFLLSGKCSKAWYTQQSSEDKVRLCSGVSWTHKTAKRTSSS